MASIFISYARNDQPRVRWISECLQRAGYSVFWDEKINVSEKWEDHLYNEVASCSYLLIVWSDAALGSEWVAREYQEAVRLDKIVVPVRIENVLPPPWASHLNVADLSSWRGNPSFHEWRRVLEILGPPDGATLAMRTRANVLLREVAAPAGSQLLGQESSEEEKATIRTHTRAEFDKQTKILKRARYTLVRLEDDLAIFRKERKFNWWPGAAQQPKVEEITVVLMEANDG